MEENKKIEENKTSSEPKNNSNKTGIIVGCIVGGIVLVIFIILTIIAVSTKIFVSNIDDYDDGDDWNYVYDKNEMKDIIGYDPKENDIHDYFEKQIKVINDNMSIYKHIRDIIVSEEDMILTTTGKVKRHEEIKKILEESK